MAIEANDQDSETQRAISRLMSDTEGRSLLKAAIKHDRSLIVELVSETDDRLELQTLIGDISKLLPLAPRYKRPPPPFREIQYGGVAMHTLISDYQFDTVLDVGAGAGVQARLFRDLGKTVTKLDFGTSVYAQRSVDDGIASITGDVNQIELDEKYDLVWASHVLEHQPNVGLFLKRMQSWCKSDGIIAITVPPLKFSLVGGHLSLWTPGHLIYNIVFSGIDCSDAKLLHYGYNISAIVRNRSADLPSLHYDQGDIKKLSRYFPPHIREKMDAFAVASRP